MKKTILIIIGVLLIVSGGWYAVSSNTPSGEDTANAEDTVAIVNEEKILRTDFEEFKSQALELQGIDTASLDETTLAQLDTQIVNDLISQALLEQAVSASEISASQEDIDQQAAAIVAQFGGQESFQQALAAEGLSEETFRTQIGANLATQTYLEQKLSLSAVTASDEEIETAYAQAAAQNENIPALEEVQVQVEQSIIQQKQQVLVSDFVEQLRSEANIEIFL